MFNLPAIQMQRKAWALNDITGGVLKATHIAYVVKYGQPPVYVITELKTGKVYKFQGSIELMRKLYNRKVFSEVLLNLNVGGYQEEASVEDRMKFIDNQVDSEIKAPKDDNLGSSRKTVSTRLQVVAK